MEFMIQNAEVMMRVKDFTTTTDHRIMHRHLLRKSITNLYDLRDQLEQENQVELEDPPLDHILLQVGRWHPPEGQSLLRAGLEHPPLGHILLQVGLEHPPKGRILLQVGREHLPKGRILLQVGREHPPERRTLLQVGLKHLPKGHIPHQVGLKGLHEGEILIQRSLVYPHGRQHAPCHVLLSIAKGQYILITPLAVVMGQKV